MARLDFQGVTGLLAQSDRRGRGAMWGLLDLLEQRVHKVKLATQGHKEELEFKD